MNLISKYLVKTTIKTKTPAANNQEKLTPTEKKTAIIKIAPMSSITASPSKNGLRIEILLLPINPKTPTANAISVATGIAHPEL